MTEFRKLVVRLEESGELVRIAREVDRKYELGAVQSKLERSGKAVIFDKVKGSGMPVIGGLMTDIRRIGMALGRADPDHFDNFQHAAEFGQANAAPVKPETVDTGPAKEVIQTGDDVDLTALPVPTYFEFDSGPFITSAVGISLDQDSGEYNVGVYRTLILGRRRMVVNASSMSDLRRIYNNAESTGGSMPIVLAIGADPALLMAAVSKAMPGVSEIDIAGALQGQPVRLAKAETSDLPVPVDAEIVIEGTIDFSEKVENTLGEYAGQYGPETAPVAIATAITHRKDALFHAITAGANPEHNTLGTISIYSMRAMLTNALRERFPNIKQLDLVVKPRLTGTMMQIFISIAKKNDEEPKQLIREAFDFDGGFLPLSRIVKRIVVVDEDVDIFDYGDVEWAIWSRVADPDKIIILDHYTSWELDRSAKEGGKSVRVGIDATMDLEDVDELIRPRAPGFENIDLNEYI
ncbi:MAG: UbiD family decarboxylase [Gammaproteobacteria bacterium]